MTVKNVLDIDVNDEKFRAYLDLFRKYQDQLAQQPAIWQRIGRNMGDAVAAGEDGAEAAEDTADAAERAEKLAERLAENVSKGAFGFGDLVAGMMAAAALQAQIEKNESDQDRHTRNQERSWHGIADRTKDVAKNIGTATASLLKWASLGTVFGGLLGMGGLFGLERLAGVASSGRRASLGLGTTYGEQQAFEVNYGRFVNADQFLSGVNEALHDVSKRYTLYTAGLTPGDLRGKDTAQVANELLQKIGPLLDRTPDALLQQLLTSRHLDQFISLEDAIRYKRTTPEERTTQARSYQRDIANLDLTDRTQRAWQDFSTQLSRAGRQIEMVLINGLTPLVDPLSHLSKAVTDLVGKFLTAAKDNGWLDKLSTKLDKFGDYLGSKQFVDDVTNFGHNVSRVGADLGVLADNIEKIFRFLHINGPAIVGAGVGAKVGSIGGPVGTIVGGVVGGVAGEVYGAAQPYDPNAPRHPFVQHMGPMGTMGTFRPPQLAAPAPNLPPMPSGPMGTFTQRPGIPDGVMVTPSPFFQSRGIDVLDLIRRLEASGDNAISPKGAVGRYQIMPDTARRYGFDPTRLTDPGYELTAAQTIVADFAKKARNLDELLVLYNSTPQYLKKFQQAGDDASILLPETRRYLEHAHQLLGREMTVNAQVDESALARAFTTALKSTPSARGGFTITVMNETGANTVISASQLQ